MHSLITFIISAFKGSSRTFFSMMVRSRPGLRRVDILVKLSFERANLLDREVIKVAAGTGEDDQNLLGERQGRELRLLQQFRQSLSAVELVAA